MITEEGKEIIVSKPLYPPLANRKNNIVAQKAIVCKALEEMKKRVDQSLVKTLTLKLKDNTFQGHELLSC